MRNKEELINSFGLSTIILSLASSPFYGIFSAYILHYSKTSALIAIVLGFILSLFISKIILSLFESHKDLTLSSKIKKAYGKFSYVINILFTLCSIAMYIFLTYRLTFFLSSQYLIETPNFVILIMIILLTFYTASKGIETTLRVSIISFFISNIIYVFDIASLIGQVNINNFLPLFTVNIKNILISSLVFAFYFSIPLIFIQAIKFNQIVDSKKFKKYYYGMLILSFILTFISMSTTIGVSGIKVNNLFDYPIYTTLKRINLFSFLDSIENISIMLWLLYIITASSMILLFIFNHIKNTFNLTKKGSLISNIIVIILALIIPTLLFSTNDFIESYQYIWYPFVVLSIMIFISLLTLIIIKVKK